MNLFRDAPCGRLRGTSGNGVEAYRNIPYATPPVGGLRFAPPQPGAPWAGTRDATAAGCAAPQGKSRLSAITGGEMEMAQSEDCLTLEVRRPMQAGDALPVMVWVHGGGFVGGAASHPWYDSSSLVRKGDVV